MTPRPPISTRTDTPFPYTTLFRSGIARTDAARQTGVQRRVIARTGRPGEADLHLARLDRSHAAATAAAAFRRDQGNLFRFEMHGVSSHGCSTSVRWPAPMSMSISPLSGSTVLGFSLSIRTVPCQSPFRLRPLPPSLSALTLPAPPLSIPPRAPPTLHAAPLS